MLLKLTKSAFLIACILLFSKQLFSQAPANDNCAGAITLTSGVTCAPNGGIAGTLNNATRSITTAVGTSCVAWSNNYDVWYRFVAVSTQHTVTISNFGANFWNREIQIYNNPCPTVSTGYLACASGGTTSATATGLTVGATYYIRISDSWTALTTGGEFSICLTHALNAASINDNCSSAATIYPGASCSSVTANLRNANSASSTAGSCGGATLSTSYDVWFQFQATSSIAIISLSNLGANLTAASTYIQTYSGTCAGLTSLGCQTAATSQTLNGLTLGGTYYVRIYRVSNPTATPTAAWNFDICIYSPAVTGSSMSEVFKQTTLVPQASGLNDPWEVTYGPDDSLWITVAKDYKVLKMHATDGGYRTVLDLAPGATGYLTAAEHTNYNRGNFTLNPSATPVAINWPQGGMMGLALHPDFNHATTPKKFVYVAYIAVQGSQSTTGAGQFYTNYLVRFTYSDGLLRNPVAVCDTLPGSSDHNSGRLITAPINGVNYLFYSSGDMGAGQFSNISRPINAQNVHSYEGKILRFNLEEDGDAVQNSGVRSVNYNRWIPNGAGAAANPYNTYLTKQSAVWNAGHRNVQGFAAANLGGTDFLYGASHGAYSDDEINILESGKNYGHPYVIGLSTDNNYTDAKAGPSTGSLPLLSNTEVYYADSLDNLPYGTGYKEPLYSFYPVAKGSISVCSSPNQYYIQDIYRNCANTGANNFWKSEAPSGIGIYTSPVIPAWKNSLLLTSLKWGRITRTKLNSTFDGLTTVNGAVDTMPYFSSRNRYRDVAVSPDGKDLYIIMDKSLSTSGPSQANPSTLNCTGCVLKYSFLGYNDNAGASTIPTSVPLAQGLNNQLTTLTPTAITSYEKNNLWVPLTDSLGNIVAEIDANGNNLDNISGTLYKNNGPVRTSSGGTPYADRSITINVQTPPGSNVNVRIYLTVAELAALVATPGSGVTSINDVFVYKNSDANGTALTSAPQAITPTRAAFGSNYVVTASVSGFSTFYFAGPSMVLPVDVLTLSGNYNNQAVDLQWKTENEKNAVVFSIEKSYNNQQFKAIGAVAASGNTTGASSYNYNDNSAGNDAVTRLYYRLKLSDINGSYKYSNTIAVALPSFTGAVTISPNPVSNELKATTTSPADCKAEWRIIDQAGRVIQKSSVLLKKGNNLLSINTSKLAGGVYYLHISGSGVECKTKFQKY